jgi:hypothetical protein
MSRCRRTRARRRRWTELLRFSDAQLRIIQDAARSVPVDHRADYLNAIAAALVRLVRFTDADVLAAAQTSSACWSARVLKQVENPSRGAP